MKQRDFQSIRMHAVAAEGRHLSGAERIAPLDHVHAVVRELLERAYQKTEKPGQVTVTIESLGDIQPRSLTSLDLVTINVRNVDEGRRIAASVLTSLGISTHAAEAGIKFLSEGPSRDGMSMRGAIIMDSRTGKRLEDDADRGVRASRFDWSDEASVSISEELGKVGLTHFRTREALALATKVAYAPNMVAELCWSDDPDYVAGYVASRKRGYVRFPFLKEPGDIRGGRIFFVESENLDMGELISYLETHVVLISNIGKCHAAINPESFIQDL